jgi:hypothetical protein
MRLSPPWHQSLCPIAEEIGVKCPYPAGGSLLYFRVYRQGASYGVQEMENKGSEIGNLGRLFDYLPAVKPATLYVWLAVQGAEFSVLLECLKSTWLIQLLDVYDVRNYENVDGIRALILKY